jgi:hypothetical protein
MMESWFPRCPLCGDSLVLEFLFRLGAACLYSSVAQWQSIRLLTGGLLVRVQPEEPIFSGLFRSHG